MTARSLKVALGLAVAGFVYIAAACYHYASTVKAADQLHDDQTTFFNDHARKSDALETVLTTSLKNLAKTGPSLLKMLWPSHHWCPAN